SNGTITFEYAEVSASHYVYAGGAVGRAVSTIGATASVNGTTFIKNIVVDANVTVNTTVRNFVGGLVGDLLYSFNILNVAVKGDITSTTTTNYNYQGGLIGRIYLSYNVKSNLAYEIKNVMFEGNVANNQDSGTTNIGSLIGYVEFHNTNPSVDSPSEIKINI